jgi:hypothetical protein
MILCPRLRWLRCAVVDRLDLECWWHHACISDKTDQPLLLIKVTLFLYRLCRASTARIRLRPWHPSGRAPAVQRSGHATSDFLCMSQAVERFCISSLLYGCVCCPTPGRSSRE